MQLSHNLGKIIAQVRSLQSFKVRIKLCNNSEYRRQTVLCRLWNSIVSSSSIPLSTSEFFVLHSFSDVPGVDGRLVKKPRLLKHRGLLQVGVRVAAVPLLLFFLVLFQRQHCWALRSGYSSGKIYKSIKIFFKNLFKKHLDHASDVNFPEVPTSAKLILHHLTIQF